VTKAVFLKIILPNPVSELSCCFADIPIPYTPT
jgi:hypothetical protein